MSFLSGVRSLITPGSQPPMSSIAAMWLASRPAEELAPCWAGVVRKPSLKASRSSSACTSSPVRVQHLSLKSLSDWALSKVSAEHSRSANQYHQWAAGQASLPPTAIGVMPASFSFCTTVLNSSQVFGVSVIPAFSNRSLEYQMPPGSTDCCTL